ncbi:MAG: hypothetical protein KDD98_09980, partial [Sphingomonadaceae bacterium]|nr:hypothetical protein [Sphingomonadaceae bacterium]
RWLALDRAARTGCRRYFALGLKIFFVLTFVKETRESGGVTRHQSEGQLLRLPSLLSPSLYAGSVSGPAFFCAICKQALIQIFLLARILPQMGALFVIVSLLHFSP